MNAYLKPSLSNDTTQVLKQNDANSVTENRLLQKAKKPTLTSYMTKDDVIESEILYVMISVYLNISINATAKLMEGLKFIFTRRLNNPDASLANQIQLGNDEIGYMINYGGGPHFHQNTLDFV
ncbi:hypothetical protein QAD02_007096 [Eretmocerus hayati]|uniref:Uncharacterized protein n=1 Tax=Eretmocerus hayati TaxID=131215 RepID=A0ACC2N538_9HYME|nr:hypothetical protein QAD02_007096 [Eretmocerus hayati]